ncbi:MAG: hypothetical protein H7257_14960 [Taibaiella sp.]|nr:hypothetical protein [Taibaiella sp.]
MPNNRTGEEVYAATFGPPPGNCVEIVSFFDSGIPIIDGTAYIRFNACPGELTRIIKAGKFTVKKEKSTDISRDLLCKTHEPSFDISSLGDSILVYNNFDNPSGPIEIIYASEDSSMVYYEEFR